MENLLKYTLYTFFLIANNFTCLAQKETNIWYFGGNAGLDFNSVQPVALLDGEINTTEGCASISDSNGNLLFYTDGITVYDASHSIMHNGSGLNGDTSSTHSAIITPKPNYQNIYYIFTADAQGGRYGLQYSEVDMTLNMGFGGITSNKNIQLYTPITEKLAAIKHATLNEYWVVSHKYGNNEFLAYRISENGVEVDPVISAVGSSVDTVRQTEFGDYIGQIKISPDGTKLALARSVSNKLKLYDFNASTGQVSNPMLLSSNISPYGIEFSPNSQILYATVHEGIYQYDISESNMDQIILSEFLLFSTTSHSQRKSLQLGPNGKIYLAKFGIGNLDVIHEPNYLGLAANYENSGVSLNGKISKHGLPPFIQSFFNASFKAVNLCYGDITSFNLTNNTQPFDSLIWDFGDGTTSTDENPLHIFNEEGDYEVSLIVTAGAENNVIIDTITIFGQPIVEPIVELIQCDDDTDGFSSFNLNEVIPDIISNITTETFSFHETALNAQNKIEPILNTLQYVNETVGSDIIFARVENSNGCFEISQVNLEVSTTQIPSTFLKEFYQCDDGNNNTDGVATFDFSSVATEIQELFPVNQQLIINFYLNEEDALSETNSINNISNYENAEYPFTQNIFVRVDNALNNDCLGLGHFITLYVNAIPQITLMTDEVSICKGDSVELIADQGFDSYNWSTGETTRIITVEEAGQYKVTISNTYNNTICSIDKTITVTESEIATVLEIETVDWTHSNNVISVFIEGLGDYEYSLDDIIYQDSNVFSNLYIDEYSIYVRDKNGCGIIKEDVYLMYYPRYFTPNGDGINDTWQLTNGAKESLNMLSIYDRYGKLMTQLNSSNLGWDGTYNNNQMPTSDYWFVLERQNGTTYTGHFTLKR